MEAFPFWHFPARELGKVSPPGMSAVDWPGEQDGITVCRHFRRHARRDEACRVSGVSRSLVSARLRRLTRQRLPLDGERFLRDGRAEHEELGADEGGAHTDEFLASLEAEMGTPHTGWARSRPTRRGERHLSRRQRPVFATLQRELRPVWHDRGVSTRVPTASLASAPTTAGWPNTAQNTRPNSKAVLKVFD
jgi:hypothetical protein